MRRVGQRRVELAVAVLHGQGQYDGLRACEAAARVANRVAARDRVALERKGAHLVSPGVQQRGQMRLPHIAADDRESRRFVHNKTSFAPVYAPPRAAVKDRAAGKSLPPKSGRPKAWAYSGLRAPPKKDTISTPGPVCEPMTVPT